MGGISDDVTFRQALEGLDAEHQRVLAALFAEHVLSLCQDERIKRVVKTASDTSASEGELAEALKTAKAATFDCHTRCGAEGDWMAQAGYFVARAVMAALTPKEQQVAGPAWQAAMSCRMAQNCRSIDTHDDSAALQERQEQYRILTEFLSL